LAVYTGADVAVLTGVMANDDACDDRSVLAFDVVAGTAYRIAVDGVAGQMGDIFLAWAMQPAPASSAPPISFEFMGAVPAHRHRLLPDPR
jgi:hypothetical protein